MLRLVRPQLNAARKPSETPIGPFDVEESRKEAVDLESGYELLADVRLVARVVGEPVSYARRYHEPFPGAEPDQLTFEPHGKPAGDHFEPFFLVRMEVVRRVAGAYGEEQLDAVVSAVGGTSTWPHLNAAPTGVHQHLRRLHLPQEPYEKGGRTGNPSGPGLSIGVSVYRCGSKTRRLRSFKKLILRVQPDGSLARGRASGYPSRGGTGVSGGSAIGTSVPDDQTACQCCATVKGRLSRAFGPGGAA